MKKLRLFVIGGLLIFTAFCGGLLASSWSSQATANSNQTAMSLPEAASASAGASQQDKQDKEAKQEKEKATEATQLDPADVMIYQTIDGEDFPEFEFGSVAIAVEAPDFAIPANEEGFDVAISTMPAAGMVSAVSIGPVFGDGTEAQGIITKIENNGTKITINKQRIINLNDQTTVGEAAGSLKKEDLKVGDRVVALGKSETDKSMTARYLLRQPALPVAVSGVVSSVDSAAKSLKFKVGKDGAEWTATVLADTQIHRNGSAISLGDLKAGDKIVVTGKADKDAKKIEANFISNGHPAISPRPPVAINANMSFGTIKSIDVASNSFVLSETVGITPTERKVVVDNDTKFAGPNGVKGLADLKVGDKVVVHGDKQADGSLKAKNVGTGVDIQVRVGPGPGEKGEKGGKSGGKPSQPPKPATPPDAPKAPEPPKDNQG